MQKIVRLTAWCIAVLWVSFVHAQTPMRDTIRAKAMDVSECLRTGDYDKLADTTFPKLVEIAGGRAKMIAQVKSTMAQAQAAGYKVMSIDYGSASEPVASEDQLFSIIPQTVHVTGPKMNLEQESFMLAISGDKGKSWTFVDGTGLTNELLKQMFPNFPTTLKFPVRPPPKITPIS